MRNRKMGYNTSMRKIIFLALAIAAGLIAVVGFSVSPVGLPDELPEADRQSDSVEKVGFQEPANGAREMKSAFVARIIDGDTIELASGEKVRYIGIDADELDEPCYEQAKQRNEELAGGKAVLLEYDEQRQDKYGRTLAYVWFSEMMINLQMITEGYAEEYNFPPNMKYAERMKKAEERAKESGFGCFAGE